MTFWKSVCLLAPLVGVVAAGAWAYLPQALSQRPSNGHPVARPSVSVPFPRWKYSAAWMRANRIVTTNDTILLYREYDGESVAAIDRATGKERWRHEVPRLPSRPFGTAEVWMQVLSSEDNLLITQVVQVKKVSDAKERFGYRTEQQVFVRGIDARTGGIRWQVSAERLGYPFPTPIQLLGVYGGKIAAVAVGQKVVVVNAATGRGLSPSRKQDQAILRRVATVTGEDYVLLRPLPGQGVWRLLHLRTGEVRSTPRSAGVAAAYVSGHLVCRVDTDNDAPGGSLFPKWLEAYDQQGKQVWQFPKKITYREDIFGTPESMVSSLHPLPALGVVLTSTQSSGLVALRARDGAVLWKKPLSDQQIEPYGNGFLLLETPLAASSGKTPHSSLAFVHGRTGRVNWLARLPHSYYFKAEGDDLVLLGADSVLRAYNGKKKFYSVHR